MGSVFGEKDIEYYEILSGFPLFIICKCLRFNERYQ